MPSLISHWQPQQDAGGGASDSRRALCAPLPGLPNPDRCYSPWPPPPDRPPSCCLLLAVLQVRLVAGAARLAWAAALGARQCYAGPIAAAILLHGQPACPACSAPRSWLPTSPNRPPGHHLIQCMCTAFCSSSPGSARVGAAPGAHLTAPAAPLPAGHGAQLIGEQPPGPWQRAQRATGAQEPLRGRRRRLPPAAAGGGSSWPLTGTALAWFRRGAPHQLWCSRAIPRRAEGIRQRPASARRRLQGEAKMWPTLPAGPLSRWVLRAAASCAYVWAGVDTCWLGSCAQQV